MIQGGEQKGRIHISPPELGRLDIDLVIKQGHLQAQLSAESPQVKELIEANLGQLKQHLADIGLVIDRFDVMVGLDQNPFTKNRHGPPGTAEATLPGRTRVSKVPCCRPKRPHPRAEAIRSRRVDMLV